MRRYVASLIAPQPPCAPPQQRFACEEQQCYPSGSASDELSSIHSRAQTRVAEFIAALPNGSNTPWSAMRHSLQSLLEQLSTECYHDGCLGPATAAVNPEESLAQLRNALQYEELNIPITYAAQEVHDRIQRELGLSRKGGGVTSSSMYEERSEELSLPLGDDAEKWLQSALPRVTVIEGSSSFPRSIISVHGPASLLAAARTALDSTHRSN